MGREDYVRNYFKYRGMRCRLRTLVNKYAEENFKYRIYLRRHGKPCTMWIELRKGTSSGFLEVLSKVCPRNKFEGIPIRVSNL